MIDGTVNGKGIKGKITKIPQIDKTLSLADQAAEAKATGEALDKKVDKASIADNVTTADAAKVLSAKQGVDLKALIDTEVQNRKNAINTLQNETNTIINGVNDAIAAANGDIEELSNELHTAEEDIAKNAEAIAEVKEQMKASFDYVGDGQSYFTSADGGRKIETGFESQAIMVIGDGKMSIITKNTGVCFFGTIGTGYSKTAVDVGATFENGTLFISPGRTGDSYYANEFLNKDGYPYTCIPL